MTIEHHPKEDTLAQLAAGALPVGPSVVVRAHLEACPACAALFASLESVGGVLLDSIAPAALGADALARTLAMIDDAAPEREAKARVPGRSASFPQGMALPIALADCDIGPWRWVGPGRRIARVRTPAEPKANLMLLRVGPGLKLPIHSHTGPEYTHVLYGSFTDGRGRYVPGDLDEADADVRHQPIVDQDGECICLAAIDGRMRPEGMIARLIQPLAGL